MRISDIVRRKRALVHTVDRGQPVRDASRLMHAARVGAVERETSVLRDRARCHVMAEAASA